MSGVEELTKKKGSCQRAFTRTYNTVKKLAETEDTPVSMLTEMVGELQEKYNSLEDSCNDICQEVDAEDNVNGQLDTMLSEKYELLSDIKAVIRKKTELEASAKIEQSSQSEDANSRLVKSFQASLTLPKPEFRKFDGNPSEYRSFISYIETYVESNVKDQRQALTILIDSCRGIAYDAVAYMNQCSNADDAYKKAKTALKDLFGGKHHISQAIIEDIMKFPQIKSNDFDAMKRLTIQLRKAEVTLTECGFSEELVSTDKLVKIYQKLPKYLQNKWNDRVYESNEKGSKPSFVDMYKMIEKYVQSRDNEYNLVDHNSSGFMSKGKGGQKHVFTVSEESSHSVVHCILCNGNHYLNQCKQFLDLSLKARFDFVSRKQLCRNCLHSGHAAIRCKRRSLCKQCSSKHNNVLHDSNFVFHVNNVESRNVAQNVQPNVSPNVQHVSNNVQSPDIKSQNVSGNTTDTVYNVTHDGVAGLACVEVLIEGSNALYKCKAIVDSKSSANLITQRLASKLNLPSVPFTTTLNVATGKYSVKGQKIKEAKIFSDDMADNVIANNILTVKSIPLSMSTVFSQDDIRGLSYLDGVKIPYIDKSDDVDLLIGSSVPKAFHQFEQRKGNDNQIYAVRQTLGWDLVGPKNSSVANNGLDCHFNSFSTEETVYLTQLDVMTSHSPNDVLKNMYHGDFSDCSLFNEKVSPSLEDIYAQELVDKSMLLKDGRFSVGIPWKLDPSNLPGSKEVALQRLYSLKKRFVKDSNFLLLYSSEMEKFIQNGYLEPSSSLDTSLCHYIPHHPVWHPRKNSIRVVWDCAVSLNDFIYEGPDLLNSLVEVLVRFRRHKFAIASDIQKMYLNVKVPQNDRGALRVLWWPNGDINSRPSEFRATVHIYGAKSSGFIANYCIKKLASEVEDPLALDVLNNDLYVDDQLSSVQNENDAVHLVHTLSAVLDQGGFHLTKFMSNSPSVMSSVPAEDRVESLDLVFGKESEYEHASLGLNWIVGTDRLGFPCVIPDSNDVPTRRKLLSMIARIYDPLGVVSPVTLPMKVLMQQKANLGWDETDEEMCVQWKEFCSTLHLVSEFTIPRCFKPSSPDFDDPVHIELHGFGDASNVGYAAAVYIRQISQSGQVSVSFVVGKSRIAPKFKGHIPQATIPKLELHAAALLAKLVDKVRRCLGFKVNEVFYWCDSQAVLSCIHSSDKRFPVYWGNRLAIIHGLCSIGQWRYVPTKLNPADIGSRGIQCKAFMSQIKFWVEGPEFLILPSENWPEMVTVGKMENIMMINEDIHAPRSELLSRLISHYSCLSKLLRVVARLQRFMFNNDTGIDSDALDNAVKALVRYEQSKLDISHLKKLKPFRDDHGVLRVHGRLVNADHLPYDTKFPAILPKSSHLTKLIVEAEHKNSAHLGPNHVLNRLRRRYWVIGGKNSIRNILSQCRKCKEENARPLQQEMAPLPEERIKPAFPFQFVGLDFFGPFMCKSRRQLLKRYGCVFVCLSSRAVHIEVVNSLESSAFLCALSRFIARRGLPQKIFSDNATNFRGAQEELEDVIRALDKPASRFASEKGFTWHFHPPLGSHHGGHYERLIRSIRRVLHGLTNEQQMTEDNLTTFLCECEKILNDRPLTMISEDANDEMPLTPNHILLLRGNSSDVIFGDGQYSYKYAHKQAHYLANVFWKRWLAEYVPTLQARQKWFTPKRNLKVDDLVLMCGEGHVRGKWPMARVVEIYEDADGLVRKVLVRDRAGVKIRPISKLALLEASD